MKKFKSYILILGAGPAGMACANRLQDSGISSTIIEKEDKIGGLAKTFEFKTSRQTFKTDIGPHRFYSKNKYLYALIKKLLGDKWRLVSRQTRQYIDGTYYDYPIQLKQVIKKIGVFEGIKI